MGILTQAHTVALYAAGVYFFVIASLAIEPLQNSIIYLHQIRLPWKADFNNPTKYGHSPGKVRNFEILTKDAVSRLGVWHILPQSIYAAYLDERGYAIEGLDDSVFDQALKTRETVLYFHGNAATRASSNRVRVGRLMSGFDKNFIVIDYRGFGDSSGSPSEEGLNTDSRSIWDWLMSKGVEPSSVIVMGQSLGTGVSTSLLANLELEGIRPKALILVAPFASIPRLLEDYKILGFPVFGPLRSIPGAIKFIGSRLYTRFDSLSKIDSIQTKILILHALDDATIPNSASEMIFDKLVQLEGSASSRESFGSWGTVSTLERKGRGKVVFGLANTGGHNEIGSGEGSIRLIEEMIR